MVLLLGIREEIENNCYNILNNDNNYLILLLLRRKNMKNFI